MEKYRSLKIFFLSLMLVSIISLIFWKVEKNQTEAIMEKVDEYLVKEEDSYVIREEIKAEKEDTVGWLIVDGTKINYPVVQTNDNKYYLKHDYYKKRSNAGWLFMDYRNRLGDQNIIIYGHHRKDGIMFGDIDKLMKEKFYKGNNGKIVRAARASDWRRPCPCGHADPVNGAGDRHPSFRQKPP